MKAESPAPSEMTLTSTVDGREATNDVEIATPKVEPSDELLANLGEPATASADDSSEADESGPPSKRTRLDHEEDGEEHEDVAAADADEVPKTPGFLKLPLELLSDVLVRTGSPEYVLAVARTCKSLCRTLLSRDAQFIWRAARQSPSIVYKNEKNPNIVLKLPDLPTEFFTEAAYAAFVFGSGNCDVCEQETSVMYASFAIRVRLCKNRACKIPKTVTNLTTHVSPMGVLLREILPVSEVRNLKPDVGSVHSGHQNFCKSSELAAIELDWELNRNTPEYKATFERLKVRKVEWMMLCGKLALWKEARVAHYHQNKKANELKGKAIASKYGWDYKEALTATSYGLYHSRQNRLRELVYEPDVAFLKDQVEAELLSHVEKVERRKAEMTLMTNRKDVETLYYQLRSKGDFKFMPSLSTFRQLPVIAMLQAAESSASASVAQTLSSNEVMQKLLATQLNQWATKAKQELGHALGFPKNWKNASKNILHPVERVTARFLCTKCQRVDVKYRDNESLDFAGACVHECGVGNAKKGRVQKGKKSVWDSSKFVKDEKAIKVLKKCVDGLKFSEDKDAANYLLSTGIAVVCTSCDPPIVIDTRNIIGHSHRHNDMQVKFEGLHTIENYLGPHPYEYGVCKTLLGPSSSTAETKKEIDRKNYGCRHCWREEQEKQKALAEAAAPPNANPADAQGAQAGVATDMDSNAQIDLASVVSRMQEVGIEGPKEHPPQLSSFNGMRSHLKAKHGIVNIRDEDIFCYESFNLEIS